MYLVSWYYYALVGLLAGGALALTAGGCIVLFLNN